MRLLFILLGTGLCVLAGWWLFLSPPASVKPSANVTAPVILSGQRAASVPDVDTHQNYRGTTLTSRPRFVLTAGSKDEFDRFIFDRQGAPAAQVKDGYRQHIELQFSEHSAQYAIAVFSRYVDYKVALSEENVEVQSSGSVIRDIADTLDAREVLRRRFFDDREYEILFAAEAAEDDRALSRLRIAGDPGLTASQKKQQIFEQLDALDEPQQAGFRPTLNMHKVAQIKQQFADNTSRYNALAALLGDEPARRMIATWQNQANWQARVEKYRGYQATLVNKTLDTHTLNNLLNEYQRTHFSENERKRLNVVLASD